MNFLAILTTSPYYFYKKYMGTGKENLCFDIGVKVHLQITCHLYVSEFCSKLTLILNFFSWNMQYKQKKNSSLLKRFLKITFILMKSHSIYSNDIKNCNHNTVKTNSSVAYTPKCIERTTLLNFKKFTLKLHQKLLDCVKIIIDII